MITTEVTRLLNKMRSEVDFEEDRFKQLCDDTSSETVLKIMAHFYETLKISAFSIEEAISSSHMETIEKAAHKISGSAELLGFVNYGTSARELSHLLRTQQNSSILNDQIVSFLKRTYGIQKSILEAFPNINQYLA